MNLVVGQGPILTTPLQMAVAYASIVNGGTVYQPRVADSIESPTGERIRTMEPRVLRRLDIDSDTVASLRADLASVVRTGTARRAFEDVGSPAGLIGGKTGTAQAFTDQDGTFHDSTAWFIGVAPIDAPRWVVVVMVDEGGSRWCRGGPPPLGPYSSTCSGNRLLPWWRARMRSGKAMRNDAMRREFLWRL